MSEQLLLLQQILEKLDQIDERISNVEKTVSELPFIKHAVLDTSERLTNMESYLKTLLSSQAKQDKILEQLAVRSISQEADIDELRRIK